MFTIQRQLIKESYRQASCQVEYHRDWLNKITYKWILFNLLMSKQFSKHKLSQQKLIGVETWSPGDYAEGSNFLRMLKPPRRVTQQQFMTTEQEYEQSNQQVSQSLKQQQKQKPRQHRRRASQIQKTEKQFEPEDEDSEPLFYNPQFKSYNTTPKLKRNESNNLIDSSKQIEQRFKEIEHIMGNENENLRQQKDYLLRTIYKLQVKQREYKNKIAQYRDKNIELQQQNRILREKYEKARDFIANGIGKMEQAISKQATQSNTNNISNSNTAHHSNDSSVNISQQIEQLNDKFDVLMYEYQKTREPEIRKRCMEIAKELRRLRKTQDTQKSNHNK